MPEPAVLHDQCQLARTGQQPCRDEQHLVIVTGADQVFEQVGRPVPAIFQFGDGRERRTCVQQSARLGPHARTSAIGVEHEKASPEKIALIERQGGKCHFIDQPSAIYDESRRLAAELGGHFMDQFTHAERATDWRGNNNIAESIFDQMKLEPSPEPDWVVVGAGTGGTSATVGRYIHYQKLNTRLAVVDPEHSVFFDAWRDSNPDLVGTRGSRIEGIGRPRVEPSFIGQVIDRMIKVPDAASVATIRYVEDLLGRRVGGSTGTNLWGAFEIVAEMRQSRTRGSVVTLLCDGGERYANTYYDDSWVSAQGMDLDPCLERLNNFHRTGNW
ncbi:PLP-dependent cysteine synthase family protein [Lentzea indica]|uniref:PLP-dependent cysteine synthase family protein n=1 Tax=Lentzea indica TaxID=2604800 RepID=UPI0028AD9F28|nr:pyridoxal-phosphate dependent enzyme [Lentzea indica]